MQLYTELLDVAQHARPSLSDIDAFETALSLNRREGAFMSYDSAFKLARFMPSGLVTRELLEAHARHKLPHLRRAIIDVSLGLNDYLRENSDRWIGVGRKPFRAFPGVFVRPSIRGLVVNGRTLAPSIVNPRRSVALDPYSLSFYMRGGVEFHLLDNPMANQFFVIDLSKGQSGCGRIPHVYSLDHIDPLPLHEFERILHTYTQAVRLSKFGHPDMRDSSFDDLFRAGR